jgi:hypothetical protein
MSLSVIVLLGVYHIWVRRNAVAFGTENHSPSSRHGDGDNNEVEDVTTGLNL